MTGIIRRLIGETGRIIKLPSSYENYKNAMKILDEAFGSKDYWKPWSPGEMHIHYPHIILADRVKRNLVKYNIIIKPEANPEVVKKLEALA